MQKEREREKIDFIIPKRRLLFVNNKIHANNKLKLKKVDK